MCMILPAKETVVTINLKYLSFVPTLNATEYAIHVHQTFLGF
jgi:hypothetical protein